MVAALFFSLALVVFLYGYHRQSLIGAEISERANDLLTDLGDTLEGLSLDEQRRWILATARPYTMHVVPLDSAEHPPEDSRSTLLGRAIASRLRERIVSATEVREEGGSNPKLWVHVDVLNEPYWLVIPLTRLRANPTWEFALSASLLVCAVLVAAAVFAWRINQPLRQLRLAAARLGRGEKPEPLPETGPLEVRELSASFNRMLGDLDINARERSVMLAGISHDLRTPLARLRLGVAMMYDTSLQGGMEQDVEDIERILQQFIDFARGDEGEAVCDIDLITLARGIAERYARTGVRLALDFADDLPLIAGRPLALSRALTNLIDNAKRYGAEPVTLLLSASENEISLSVRDHGKGIPPEKIAEALKPFHRLDSARRADGGSGLGLAIVERIVRLHSGHLTLSNCADGGLNASIRLPRRLTSRLASPSLPRGSVES